MSYQWQANYSAVSLVLPAMLVYMIFAVAAPAPKRPMQLYALAAIMLAMLLMSTASLGVVFGLMSQNTALLIIGCGVFFGISSVWLGRGRSSGEDDDGGGEDKDDPDLGPSAPSGLGLDWSDFDDHRSDWEEDRQPVVQR